MNHIKILIQITLCAVLVAVTIPLRAAPLDTTFTYQGSLQTGGAPANGNYDLIFALFNAPVAGAQFGTTWTNLNVGVSNGLFTVPVDFGSGIFDGTAYWLAVGVRSTGSGAVFSPLTPRQSVTPRPTRCLPSGLRSRTIPWAVRKLRMARSLQPIWLRIP